MKLNTKITIKTEFITLGQLLKFAGIIQNGAEAKIFIMEHEIKVNNEDCKQRGKKIRATDLVEIDNESFFEIIKWLLKVSS